MLITLRELELHRIVVSKTYLPGAIDYHEANFRQKGPLKVEAVAELLGSEIRIRGHLAACLESNCDQCLGPVEIPVDHDFDLFYRPLKTIAREEEFEIPEKEMGVSFYSGEGIRLADVVSEQVILSLPMKLVCREGNCLGLCPICGADRNHESCHCSTTKRDSPFAKLRGE